MVLISLEMETNHNCSNQDHLPQINALNKNQNSKRSQEHCYQNICHVSLSPILSTLMKFSLRWGTATQFTSVDFVLLKNGFYMIAQSAGKIYQYLLPKQGVKNTLNEMAILSKPNCFPVLLSTFICIYNLFAISNVHIVIPPLSLINFLLKTLPNF